jgi:hypothetical protein
MSKAMTPAQTAGRQEAPEAAPKPTKLRRTIVSDDGKVEVAQTPESMAEFERAFGSDAPDFQLHTLGQVLNVIGTQPDMTVSGNAALAVLAAIKPTNEMEAVLAAQMVAAHHFAMLSWSRAARHGELEGAQANAAMANKASRTFTLQMEALAKMRRGGEQVVRHVHVNDGGQAVIAGTVNASQGGGG